MNEQKDKVRIFLKNGFRYEGTIINENDEFLTIQDTVKDKEITIAKDQISVKEKL